MIRNYWKIALRTLRRHRAFSLINILGLSIGISVFMLISAYVHFERSYESFLPDAENIYRVTIERYLNNALQLASAENVPGVGPALHAEFPEVTGYARLYNLGYKNNVIITNPDASPSPVAFKHRRFMYADSAFLPMMGYPMYAGDEKTALAEPLKAVLSESYAIKYFGTKDVLGKTLVMQDDDFNHERVEITGVFRDLPANTHLKFDILFSYKTLFSRFDQALMRYHQTWNRNDMYTFIRLREGTEASVVEARLPALIQKYQTDQQQTNRKDVMKLQPLRDIHLTSDLAEEPEPNGDARVVRFLSIIGLIVLIIAWINYVNLSTARAMERAREVGVRKVSGAVRSQLLGQFLVESAILNGVALVIACGMIALALPLFNQITGLDFGIASFGQPWVFVALPLLWIAGTVLAGFYPAWVLSAYRPIVVLRGSFRNSMSGALLRKALVVVQFFASVLLLAGTLVISRQIDYLLNKDIGMDIDQVMVVERPGIAEENDSLFNHSVYAFRAELKKNPAVLGVSTSLTIPGKQREYKGAAKRYGADDRELVSLRVNSMDYEFIDVFQMRLIAGRAFGEAFPADQDTSVIITESGAKLLGFATPEAAINQVISVPAFQWNPIIAGVVNDYHQVSLKTQMDPTIFYCTTHDGEFYSLRVRTEDLEETIAHVEKSWSTAFPGNPFQYFFLDEFFHAQYANERRFGKLAGVFAILAIIVGCLGLFGLSGYLIAQRTKEIGIRKVLGATESGIILLLSKDTLKLVLIATLIAVPFAWWSMSQWLQDYAYRINIGWTVFALAGLIALCIALLTISVQTLKAAFTNPVESLRSE